MEEFRFDEDRPFSPSTNPNQRMRSSAGSMRTRTSDYDSGFGTHNTTKLSRDRFDRFCSSNEINDEIVRHSDFRLSLRDWKNCSFVCFELRKRFEDNLSRNSILLLGRMKEKQSFIRKRFPLDENWKETNSFSFRRPKKFFMSHFFVVWQNSQILMKRKVKAD